MTDVDQYRAFVETIAPEARRKRIAIATSSAAAALIVFVWWGMLGGHQTQAINASALILDIGGAVLLVSGLFLSPRMIGEMGAQRLGGNDAPRRYWDAIKTDAKVALALLVLGFVGQIVADVLR